MFFIGPSVNIFVYLLVSAFFVICFYSQTEIRFPEAIPGQEKIIEYRIGKNEIYKKQNSVSSQSKYHFGKACTFYANRPIFFTFDKITTIESMLAYFAAICSFSNCSNSKSSCVTFILVQSDFPSAVVTVNSKTLSIPI